MDDWNGTTSFSRDLLNRIVKVTDHDGKTVEYGWDAEGNRLSEMQYNHGQSGSNNGNSKSASEAEVSTESETEKGIIESIGDWVQGLFSSRDEAGVSTAQLAAPDTESLSTSSSIANSVKLPDATANTAAGLFLTSQAEAAEETNDALIEQLNEAEELNEANTGEDGMEDTDSGDSSESNKPETGKENATIDGNGDGNGQIPPGMTEDEDGNIVNPGGNMPPGLNRGEKGEKPDNPDKPEKPENPGTEDKDDKKANKANKGTHLYEYDELNRMVSSNIAKTETTYTYDTLGNLVLEETKNKGVDYQYNELNQLISKKAGNESYTYTYDKRGNRVAETGKKESRTYVYDETNRMVEGTNWKGDKSSYTYNGLGIRLNNTQTTHAGQVYSRDYVIDYTSYENDDLMIFAYCGETVEYEQKQVYAGSERIEQYTDKGNWERLLYVHEDIMGNTRYYTKNNGQSYAELTYDAWGNPVSPNKLLNNDHGNFVYATFTGHIYDTTLDIYFAETRFYDAANRTWLAMDPVKDGSNWYQYCGSNPITYWDPLGLKYFSEYTCGALVISKPIQTEIAGHSIEKHLSVFLQSSGTVYFFSFEAGKTKFIEVDDYGIFDSMDTINEWIQEQYKEEYEGQEPLKDYEDAIYIKGNFTDSVEQVQEWFENAEKEKNGKLLSFDTGYREKPSEVFMNRVSIVVGGFEPEYNYSLLFNNCADVAVQVVSLGKFEDGSSMGEKIAIMEKRYEDAGINPLPSQQMHILKTVLADGESAY